MKRNVLWLLASAAVMIALPALAPALVPPDAGMAVMLLLFYVLNPLYSLLAGYFAGRAGKRSWFQPLVVAALFPIGMGIGFTWTEPVFWGYAAVYLALGYAAFGLARFFLPRKS